MLTVIATNFAIAAAMLASPVEAEADAPAPRPERLEPVNIPQELSPALMPYLVCRQTEQGVSLYGKDGKLLNPASARQDCSVVREKSRGKVVGRMKDLYLGRNRTERLAVADYWLNHIDSLTEPTID
jgi:hypothetical protein